METVSFLMVGVLMDTILSRKAVTTDGGLSGLGSVFKGRAVNGI